eukprot:TRINITY_DN6702_c0_g1_i2.p1 TRINITY_DN6702_c0_g1~~TRINITY_DN6702_c0_g1_i2.p1  ORF type:complete len:928 (-),score=71.80 TRINITY_DN6702_c0_g1_i2:78-2861(-)
MNCFILLFIFLSTCYSNEIVQGQQPLDIYFVSDNTGSMGSVIQNVKQCANKLLSSLVEVGHGSLHFGVGAFDNYDDNSHFQNFVSITDNLNSVKQGFGKWRANGGGSENVLVALYRVATTNIGWREDAVKIVIVFGDHPGKDNFRTKNDNIVVTEAKTIQALNSKGIRANFIDMSDLNQKGQAVRIANATAGHYSRINTGNNEISCKIEMVDGTLSGDPFFVSILETVVDIQREEEEAAANITQKIVSAVDSENSTTLISVLDEEILTVPGDGRRVRRILADRFITTNWDSVEIDLYAEVIAFILTNKTPSYQVLVNTINSVINEHGCNTMYGLLVASLLSAEDQGQEQAFIDSILKEGFDKCYVTDFVAAPDDAQQQSTCNLTSIDQTMIDSLFDPSQAANAAEVISTAMSENSHFLVDQVLYKLIPALETSTVTQAGTVIALLVSKGAKSVTLHAIQNLIVRRQINITVDILTQATIYNTSFAEQVIEYFVYSYENGNSQLQDDILVSIEHFIYELFDKVVPAQAAGVIIADLAQQKYFQDALVRGIFQLQNSFNSNWVTNAFSAALLREVNATSEVLILVISQDLNNSSIISLQQMAEQIIQNMYTPATSQQLGVIIAKFARIQFYAPVYQQINSHITKVVEAYILAISIDAESVSELISDAISNGISDAVFLNAIALHMAECTDTKQSSIVISTISRGGHHQTVVGVLDLAGQQLSRLRIAYVLKDAFKLDVVAVAQSVQLATADPVNLPVVTDSVNAVIVESTEIAGDIIAVLISNETQAQIQVCAFALIQAVYDGVSDKASTSIVDVLKLRNITSQKASSEGVAKIGSYILSETRNPLVVDMYTAALIKASQRGGHYVKASATIMGQLITHEYGIVLLESIPRAVSDYDSQCTTVIESMSRAVAFVDVRSRPEAVVILIEG